MPRLKKSLLIIAIMVLMFIPTQAYAYQLVILGPNNEVIKYKEGKTVEGDTAFSVLKKSGVSYVDEGDKYPQYKGCYITSINGIGISKSQGWVFTVNGQWQMQSASETPIHGDDKVMWCAYANQENQYSYQWPALSTKTESKSEDLVSYTEKEQTKTKEESAPTKEKSSKSEQKTEQPQESNNEEQTPKENENYDVNAIVQNMLAESNQTNTEGAIQETQKPFDFRILGYIGFIISFIIALQLYKIMKGDNHEKDKD